jgi:hypothetical protein
MPMARMDAMENPSLGELSTSACCDRTPRRCIVHGSLTGSTFNKVFSHLSAPAVHYRPDRVRRKTDGHP